jgi:FMN reductase (NADPH)/FMN reductase [NAD(P)H]
LKPKQPASVIFHKNAYRQDTDALVDELDNYDAVVREYNRNRAGGTSDNDWCDHILDYYRHAMDYRIFDYLKAQGFDVQK